MVNVKPLKKRGSLDAFLNHKSVKYAGGASEFADLYNDSKVHKNFKKLFQAILKGEITPKSVINAHETQCFQNQKMVWHRIAGTKVNKRNKFSVFWDSLKDYEKYSEYVKNEVLRVVYEGCSRIAPANFVVGVYGSLQKGYGDYCSDIDLFVIFEEKERLKKDVFGVTEAFTLAATLALGYVPCGSYQIEPDTNLSKASYYHLDTMEPLLQSSQNSVKCSSIKFWEGLKKTASLKIHKIATKQHKDERMFLFQEVYRYYKGLYSTLLKNPFAITVHDVLKCISYYSDSKMLSKIGISGYVVNNSFRRKVNLLIKEFTGPYSLVWNVGSLMIQSKGDPRRPVNKVNSQVADIARRLEIILDPKTISFEF